MLADEIKKFFQGDVLVDEATLEKFSRDYSVFKVRPQVVVFPKNVDDVKNLVKFVAKKRKAGEDISLTGRSAGTDMTGGPLSQSIIVSFPKYFNRIIEIKKINFSPSEREGGRLRPKEFVSNSFSHAEGPLPSVASRRLPSPLRGEEMLARGGDREIIGEVTVQPGVYFRDLEKQLTARGLLYPAFPASKDLCALGGMINNNSGGEKTLAYGKTEDYVRELTVVLADGELHTLRPLEGADLKKKLKEKGFEGDAYRALYKLVDTNNAKLKKAKPDVSKNSAGYYLWNVWDKETGVFDITKLFVGSQGTLGLVVEAKLGLVKLKKHSRMAVVFLKDLTPVGDLVEEVLKFHPESIESYDDKTIEVAVKLWRQVIKSMKGGVISLAFQFLPEAMMVLRGGMPKMIMLVELTGDDEDALVEKLKELGAAIHEFGTTHAGVQVHLLHNEGDEQKYWTIRRQSFALLHNNTTGKDTAPFIDDFIVKPEYMPEVLPKVNAILQKYKNDLIYTIAGHPGNGNFHIIPLMDLKDARVRALIPKISEEVYKLVHEYHGSFTAEHNDGLIRTPYLKEMYGAPITKLFADTKKIFDPLDMFNPGKKVGGSLKYSVEHIKSSQ